jgi:DNA-binding response OmpR family regulator
MQSIHLPEGKQAMAAERPILIVEDDEALRETLVEQLAEDGEFIAVLAASVEETEAKLAHKDARFDVIILDINLPDGDGRELCARLRKKGHGMPIIMLTGSAAGASAHV